MRRLNKNRLVVLQSQESLKDKAKIEWASKLQEAANLVLATLVLGQVFSDKFNSQTALAGLVLFTVVYIFAYFVMTGGVK